MVPPDRHDHGHDRDHGHARDHAHSHGPASPHPAQPAGWSILRMPAASRLTAALALGAGLWMIVWLAMR